MNQMPPIHHIPPTTPQQLEMTVQDTRMAELERSIRESYPEATDEEVSAFMTTSRRLEANEESLLEMAKENTRKHYGRDFI